MLLASWYILLALNIPFGVLNLVLGVIDNDPYTFGISIFEFMNIGLALYWIKRLS